jgi:hypothetical protein
MSASTATGSERATVDRCDRQYRNCQNWSVIFLWLLASCALCSRADSIPGLYNTGLTTEGSVEPNYAIVAPPRTAFVVAPQASDCCAPWVPNSATSKWIAPHLDRVDVPTNFIYRLKFNLADLDATSAVLTGRWATDDDGAIFLDGVNTGIRRTNGWSSFSGSFTIVRGFLAGTNIVDFIVTNLGDRPNPTGLRVELSGTADRLPKPPVLSNPRFVANGVFAFRLNGETNSSYGIETTADSFAWAPIASLVLTSSFADWFDTNSPGFRRRFYRARVLP